MEAVIQTAQKNADVLKMLNIHIGMGLQGESCEDRSIEIQIKIAGIDAEFKQMLSKISSDTVESIDEDKASELMSEKQRLQHQLEQFSNIEQKRESAQSRLDEIYTILEGMKNHPMEYDDHIIRQILECVIVETKDEIKVVFVGGLEVRKELK